MRTAILSRGLGALLLALGLGGLTGCGHGCPFCRHDRTSADMPMPVGAVAQADPFGGQQTCPVTGARLGAAGPAVPVTMKGQTIYVCCAGCAAKVQADPDAYLAKALAERSGGRVSATGPYGGQRYCPVTNEELDPAGGAVAVAVGGDTVYVCCAGCADKVRRNPELYLAKVRAERGERAAGR